LSSTIPNLPGDDNDDCGSGDGGCDADDIVLFKLVRSVRWLP